jgi:hypothetical protein
MYQGLNTVRNCPLVAHVNGATFVDYYQGNNSNYVSLLQFIKDNPTDYPNAQLYTFGNSSNSNSLGI